MSACLTLTAWLTKTSYLIEKLEIWDFPFTTYLQGSVQDVLTLSTLARTRLNSPVDYYATKTRDRLRSVVSRKII